MTFLSLDIKLLFFINHTLENHAFDSLMPLITMRGYLLIIPFILAMLLRSLRQRDSKGKTFFAAAVWTVLIACCSAYCAGWVEDWMKGVVARVRPCQSIEGIRLILSCPKSYSMPSGHAISSFAFALPLYYLTRDYIALVWRMYPLLLAAIIAFSRVYLGVHYPSDVAVGALLGTFIGMGLSVLYQGFTTEEFMKRLKH